METAPLKSFATWARTALIREVNARIVAVLAPASKDRVESASAVAALEHDIAAAGGGNTGGEAVADKVAYTWFNRIIALRFMDANGYTGIGIVSPPRGQTTGQPEVLADSKRGSIDPAVVMNKRTIEEITALLDGTRRSDDPQGEAYALLLAEYCRHWNRSMPFMFEREGDYTELLIPANLLADDSVLARAVTVLTEDVCRDVEVIGWLYQFYISERKDEVFAGFKKNKKAGAAEIPAATQLFTPHWIVRYLVENSLGRLWLLNRPTSRLADQMEYYIKPVDAETDFLKASSPEELKIIDPAVGSGHMLTYAFDLLYAIYEEDGYAPADIPSLILQHNLYGTEIDPRAGALAAFALAMKARAKQRTFFSKGPQPNVCVLQPISFDQHELDYLWSLSNDSSIARVDADVFWNSFEHAGTFGSLIRPSETLPPILAQALDYARPADGDLITASTQAKAYNVLEMTEYLSQRYVVVIANPPYMGSANMSAELNDWMKRSYPHSKADLFGGFIERGVALLVRGGFNAMVTMQTWMFLGGFESLRRAVLTRAPIVNMAHLGTGSFDTIAGEVVSTTAFVLERDRTPGTGTYVRLASTAGAAAKAQRLRDVSSGAEKPIVASAANFTKIPSSPVAYWVSDAQVSLYESGRLLGAVGAARKGIDTGENARFVRFWFEVSIDDIRLEASSADIKWVPYNKGGPNVRWYGNRYWVVNWAEDGAEIKSMSSARTRRSTIRNPDYFFRDGFTYTTVSPGRFSARYTSGNAVFDSGGGTYFADRDLMAYGALLNSEVASRYFEFLAPTLNYQPGDVSRIPVAPGLETLPLEGADAVELARRLWDSSELSWDFRVLGLADEQRVDSWASARCAMLQRLREDIAAIEYRNDLAIADLYGMVVDRDGPEEIAIAFKPEAAIQDLISYAVGCMFGRYDLDEPGLILAGQGDTLRGYLARVPSPSFMPDRDNVIPIVDGDWFEDDIVARFRQFLRVAFGEEHFEENLRFVTEALGVKDLRDYFVKSFYKDHVQRYKKRPIYWLFSSPKGSFSALIYMHRYTPSTVSTVLNEYLREFKSKLEASRQHHVRLAASDGTPREKAAAEKEVDRLRKVLLELNEYEHDVLYPLATQQMAIDLDDGVKANYPKFGTALKKIPGLEASDE